MKWFEKEGVNHREVTSPDFMGVVLEETAPILPNRFFSHLFHVCLDGAFVHHNLQLKQLTVDFLGTPLRIFSDHLLDKFDSFVRNARFAALGCGFQFPETTKHVPMPALGWTI